MTSSSSSARVASSSSSSSSSLTTTFPRKAECGCGGRPSGSSSQLAAALSTDVPPDININTSCSDLSDVLDLQVTTLSVCVYPPYEKCLGCSKVSDVHCHIDVYGYQNCNACAMSLASQRVTHHHDIYHNLAAHPCQTHKCRSSPSGSGQIALPSSLFTYVSRSCRSDSPQSTSSPALTLCRGIPHQVMSRPKHRCQILNTSTKFTLNDVSSTTTPFQTKSQNCTTKPVSSCTSTSTSTPTLPSTRNHVCSTSKNNHNSFFQSHQSLSRCLGYLMLFILLTSLKPAAAASSTFTSCGGRLEGTHGIIQTPNFPAAFPVPCRCRWSFHIPHDQKVVLYFSQYFLKKSFTVTEYDTLELHNPRRIMDTIDEYVTSIVSFR